MTQSHNKQLYTIIVLRQKILPLLALPLFLSGCSMFGDYDDEGRTLAPVRATSKPYKIKGNWYHPQPYYEYNKVGVASFYGGGDVFHGRPTATGERFDMNGMTAAHKTLPLPCMVEVTNLKNGRQVYVKVNDRGPFIGDRIIDMSRRGAQLLGFEQQGTTMVRVRTLVPETLAMNDLPPTTPTEQPILLAEEPPTLMAALEYETPTVLDMELISDGPYVHATLPPPPPIVGVPQGPTEHVMTGLYVDVGEVSTMAAGHQMASPLAEITDVAVVEMGNGSYAVRMGPLNSLADADRLVDHLENVGHDAPRIVRNR